MVVALFPRQAPGLSTSKDETTIQALDHAPTHNQVAAELNAIADEIRGGSAINLKHYQDGAGGGVSNDIAAWNWAAAQMGTGGRLYLPRGTYIMSALAMNTANVMIEGDGPGATIIKAASGVGGSFVNLNANKIYMRNLTVDANQPANSGAVGSAVALGASDITLDNVDVKNFNSLGITADVTRPKIVNCSVTGISSSSVGSYMGIWYDSQFGAVDVFIFGCTITGLRANGIFIGGRGSRVFCNVLYLNHYGTSPGGGQIAHASASHAIDSIIEGNTIHDGANTQTCGVECDVTGLKMLHNIIRGHDNGGVVCQSGSSQEISNNIISNSGRTGQTMPAIQVNSGLSNMHLNFNRGYDDRGTKYQTYVVKIDAGATYYVVIGNIGVDNLTGNVLDNGGAVTKYLAGNL